MAGQGLVLAAALLLQGDPEFDAWASFKVGSLVKRRTVDHLSGTDAKERVETFTLRKFDGEVCEVERARESAEPSIEAFKRPPLQTKHDLGAEDMRIGDKVYKCQIQRTTYSIEKAVLTVQRWLCEGAPVPGGRLREIQEVRSGTYSQKQTAEVASIREGVELTLEGRKVSCTVYEEDSRRIGWNEPRRRKSWYAKDAPAPNGIVRWTESYTQGEGKFTWSVNVFGGEKAKVGDREVESWRQVTALEKGSTRSKDWKSREQRVEIFSREVPGWLIRSELSREGSEGAFTGTVETLDVQVQK